MARGEEVTSVEGGVEGAGRVGGEAGLEGREHAFRGGADVGVALARGEDGGVEAAGEAGGGEGDGGEVDD